MALFQFCWIGGGGGLIRLRYIDPPLLFYYFLIGGSKYYGCDMLSSSYFKSHSNQIKFYTRDILNPLVFRFPLEKVFKILWPRWIEHPISNSIREGDQNIMVTIYWNIFLLSITIGKGVHSFHRLLDVILISCSVSAHGWCLSVV